MQSENSTTPTPLPFQNIQFFDCDAQIDRILDTMNSHRGLAVWSIYALLLLLNFVLQTDGSLELLLFFVFTLTMFVQAYKLGPGILYTLVSVLIASNTVMWLMFPYEYSSVIATWAVYAFVVKILHGLDGRGYAFSVLMTGIRYLIPWYPRLPPIPMSIITAHCTSFGAYGLGHILINSRFMTFETFAYLFAGLTIPSAPVVSLKEITDKSVRLSWAYPPDAVQSVHVSHVIEVNGQKVHETPKRETSIEIDGLAPNTMYRVRVWSIGKNTGKTPSDYLVLKTSKLKESKVDTGNEKELEAVISEDDASTSREEKSSTAVPPPAYTEQPASPTASMKEVERLQEELLVARRQYEEMMRSVSEAENASNDEETNLQAELARLRDLRKAEEEPRAKVRSRLRALEEAKREIEATRLKLDRELKSKLATIAEKEKAITRYEREANRSREDIRRMEAQMEIEENEANDKKVTLEEQIRELEQESVAQKAELAAYEEQFAGYTELLTAKRKELETVTSQNAALEKLEERWEAKKLVFEGEQRELRTQYSMLMKENHDLQEELREMNRAKMGLLEQLARVRRDRDPERSREHPPVGFRTGTTSRVPGLSDGSASVVEKSYASSFFDAHRRVSSPILSNASPFGDQGSLPFRYGHSEPVDISDAGGNKSSLYSTAMSQSSALNGILDRTFTPTSPTKRQHTPSPVEPTFAPMTSTFLPLLANMTGTYDHATENSYYPTTALTVNPPPTIYSQTNQNPLYQNSLAPSSSHGPKPPAQQFLQQAYQDSQQQQRLLMNISDPFENDTPSMFVRPQWYHQQNNYKPPRASMTNNNNNNFQTLKKSQEILPRIRTAQLSSPSSSPRSNGVPMSAPARIAPWEVGVGDGVKK